MPPPAARVVVTGLGSVTPYGVGVPAFWDGLLAGRPTARTITRFDVSRHAVRFACEVPAFDPAAHLPTKLARQTDPFTQYALVAAEEALSDAGLGGDGPHGGRHAERLALRGDVDPDRVGTCVATAIGAIDETTTQHERLRTVGPERVRPYLAIALPVNMAAGQVALRHGLRGPSLAVASACASATDAIGTALDLLRNGRADAVVAGGTDAAVNPVTLAGFAASGALSSRNDDPAAASRPFDVDRDGFVTAEGAGLLVLERAEHAAARGARGLAEVAGYAATNDAYHPTRPAPGGSGAARAIRLALRDAALEPGDVDHVNAHGTSTQANDAAEAAALRAVFGAHADRLAVTSTKSAVGHLLGASGGVEAIATVMAIVDGVVPATLNLDRQDPACDIDVVTGEARKVAVGAAVSTSLGFGGHNAAVVFRAAAAARRPRQEGPS